jgi:predicted PurR-regulated permease PerM
VQQKVNSLDIESVSGQAVGVAQGVLLGVAESLFNVVLVIVVSVYMLLDAPPAVAVPAAAVPAAEAETTWLCAWSGRSCPTSAARRWCRW